MRRGQKREGDSHRAQQEHAAAISGLLRRLGPRAPAWLGCDSGRGRSIVQGAVIGAGVALCFMYWSSRGVSEVDAKESKSHSIYHELKTFTDVISIVQRDYVSKVDSRKLVEGAIKGMLTSSRVAM